MVGYINSIDGVSEDTPLWQINESLAGEIVSKYANEYHIDPEDADYIAERLKPYLGKKEILSDFGCTPSTALMWALVYEAGTRSIDKTSERLGII